MPVSTDCFSSGFNFPFLFFAAVKGSYCDVRVRILIREARLSAFPCSSGLSFHVNDLKNSIFCFAFGDSP